MRYSKTFYYELLDLIYRSTAHTDSFINYNDDHHNSKQQNVCVLSSHVQSKRSKSYIMHAGKQSMDMVVVVVLMFYSRARNKTSNNDENTFITRKWVRIILIE